MLPVLLLVSQESTWTTIEKEKNLFHLKCSAYVVKIGKTIFPYNLEDLEF